MRAITRSTRTGLTFSAAAAAGIGLAIDAVIFAIRPPAAASTPGFPPSWVIGAVWVLLFGLMGAAWWTVRSHRSSETAIAWGIVLLLLVCAAYPFYTGMFSSRQSELIGNAVTILLALFVAALCWRVSRAAALLVLPTAAWVLLLLF